MYDATERHGTSAGIGPPVLDATAGIAVAGKAAGLSTRRDIARRTTGRTSFTLAATDGGMPINMAMKPMRSTGFPESHGQVMSERLPMPGVGWIMLSRATVPTPCATKFATRAPRCFGPQGCSLTLESHN